MLVGIESYTINQDYTRRAISSARLIVVPDMSLSELSVPIQGNSAASSHQQERANLAMEDTTDDVVQPADL